MKGERDHRVGFILGIILDAGGGGRSTTQQQGPTVVLGGRTTWDLICAP